MIYLTKIFIPFVIVAFISPWAVGQIAEDALRLSRIGPVGSARIQAMGGAGFSLGGDVSSAAINPAGLGFYNRSEIIFTPSFNGLSTSATYVDQSRDLTDNNFGITNFGLVYSKPRESYTSSNWKGGTFAVTYNRIDRSRFDYQFDPTLNDFSILDEFAQQANGRPFNDLRNRIDNDNFTGYAEAAFFNYLINPDASETNYVPSIPEDVIADQDGAVIESSRLSQWNFSYGGNFNDKFYIGAGLGIKSFELNRSNTFNEFYLYTDDYINFIDEGNYFFPVDGGPSIDYVNSNRLVESQQMSAIGINGTFGAIYRPVEEVTIGLSYQTPTVFGVSEDYGYRLESEVNGIINDDNEPPFNIEGQDGVVTSRPVLSEYSLNTPSRLGLGLSYFIQKYGFITADVEYINYEKHRYRSNTLDPNLVEGLNQVAINDFGSAINYRFGGEFRYQKFRARAGYSMQRSPLQIPGDRLNRNQTSLSGGLGVRLPNFFVDLTVVSTQFEDNYRPYTYATYFPLDQSRRDNQALNVLLTLGFNF